MPAVADILVHESCQNLVALVGRVAGHKEVVEIIRDPLVDAGRTLKRLRLDPHKLHEVCILLEVILLGPLADGLFLQKA